MLLEQSAFEPACSPWEGDVVAAAATNDLAWTVLIPFFNERRDLPRTIASLAAQDRPARLILIDNGSTDGSATVAAAACRRLGIAFTLVEALSPGKVSALAAGLNLVRTVYVATCDADTWYPADYLSQATRLLEAKGAAAAGAFFAPEDADEAALDAAAARIRIVSGLLPRQCHSGGAGQAFRTAALRRVGGFDATRWNWVLEDHEIMHRIVAVGAIEYGPGFWCAPSPRDRDRASIRWTLMERILYHATPTRLRDLFFYRFLAARLKARRLTSDRIRERQFQHPAANDGAVRPLFG
jgi:glycosyltransferase involved in cell wall biosynthesis